MLMYREMEGNKTNFKMISQHVRGSSASLLGSEVPFIPLTHKP